jgi:hypothetical protein
MVETGAVMLSEEAQRLVSAAVDGELDYLDRVAAKRLMRESKEARQLYRKLKGHSRRLKQMSRATLPPHFSCQVLHALGEEAPARPSALESVSKRADRFLPVWANLAAAAAVFLAICAGTLLIVLSMDREPGAVAHKDVKVDRPERIAAPGPFVPDAGVAANSRSEGQGNAEQLAALPSELIDSPAPIPGAPASQATPLAGPFTPHGDPHMVEPLSVPPPLAVRDLDQPEQRRRLVDALSKDDAFQFDLFCRDSGKGLEHVLAALRSQGVHPLIDAVAQERLNRKLKTGYAVYFDSLTPEEVTKLFQSLAAEERRAEARHEQQLDKLVTLKFSAESQKLLGTLLGVEPKWLREKAKAGSDPLKPVTESTAEALARKFLEKNGPAMPLPRAGDHKAVVVTYDPPRPSAAGSREVSLFLSLHKERKPGTIAVLLLLR